MMLQQQLCVADHAKAIVAKAVQEHHDATVGRIRPYYPSAKKDTVPCSNCGIDDGGGERRGMPANFGFDLGSEKPALRVQGSFAKKNTRNNGQKSVRDTNDQNPADELAGSHL
jgi:hypothetical protein